jgi:hypothetical protein
MKKVMRDQGGECWFDLYHTWPNGQVWALITRPDRGRPARVWLVGPRRTVPIRGGGGQGLKRRGSLSRHPTPNPSPIPRVALPAVGCPSGGATALCRPFSTDNDAMVAVSSFPKLAKGQYHFLSLIFSLFSLVLPFMVGSMCYLSNGETTTH